MRPLTVSKLAQVIQMLHLDGHAEYTLRQLADASGMNRKTLSENLDMIDILEFALKRREYELCIFQF